MLKTEKKEKQKSFKNQEKVSDKRIIVGLSK